MDGSLLLDPVRLRAPDDYYRAAKLIRDRPESAIEAIIFVASASNIYCRAALITGVVPDALLSIEVLSIYNSPAR